MVTQPPQPRQPLLYHYTRLAVALEHILPSGRLRLSPLSVMRDPRESKEWLPTHGGDDAEYTWPEGAFDAFREELAAAKDRIKVLSLTENRHDVDPYGFDETGCGYAHPRLWEQYAENHRGVCLGFDRDSLVTQLFDELRPEGTPLAASVEYIDEPLIPGLTAKTVIERGVAGAVDYLIESRLRELLFRKTTDWESEVEFRVAVRTSHDGFVDARAIESLREVIIGSETPLVYLPSLRVLCEPHGVAVKRMWWQNGEPFLFHQAPPYPPDPDEPQALHLKVRFPIGDWNPEDV